MMKDSWAFKAHAFFMYTHTHTYSSYFGDKVLLSCSAYSWTLCDSPASTSWIMHHTHLLCLKLWPARHSGTCPKAHDLGDRSWWIKHSRLSLAILRYSDHVEAFRGKEGVSCFRSFSVQPRLAEPSTCDQFSCSSLPSFPNPAQKWTTRWLVYKMETF